MNVNEQAVFGAAKYLKSESSEYNGTDYPTIRGIAVDVPYQRAMEGVLISTSRFWGMSNIPDGVWDSYCSMEKLFSEDEFPEGWISFLTEVAQLRIERASEGPVDIVRSAFFTIAMNEAQSEALRIKQFDYVEGGNLDLRNIDDVKSRIDTLLNNSELRARMLNIAANLIPQESPGFIM